MGTTWAPRLRSMLGPGADEQLVAGLGVGAAIAALVGFFVVGATLGPDAWVPLLLVGLLAAVSLPICSAMAGRPMDRRLRTILVVAFALKMLCAMPRYLVNEVTYDGNADAGMYHEAGRTLRENVSAGSWSIEGSTLTSFAQETRVVGYVTGALYLVIGSSQMGGYLFFAWLSWIGSMCVLRAFQISYPNAPPHRAAVLILLLPSMLYWPSSIGKDALMVLAIGLMVLGVARVVNADRMLVGLGWLALGAVGALQVRPHLVMVALVGAAVALIARGARGRSGRSTAIGRVVLLAALVPLLLVGLSRMDDVFGGTNDRGTLRFNSALADATNQTAIGGSAFETQPVQTPLDLPIATANVLYRPLLVEARSVPALVSALEGTALLVGTVVGARWLWRIGPAARRHPMAAFGAGYVVAFVVAFSNIANAGILARQRVQLFPVLMLLVAAAAEHRRLAQEPAPPIPLRGVPSGGPSGIAAPNPPNTPTPRLVPVP